MSHRWQGLITKVLRRGHCRPPPYHRFLRSFHSPSPHEAIESHGSLWRVAKSVEVGEWTWVPPPSQACAFRGLHPGLTIFPSREGQPAQRCLWTCWYDSYRCSTASFLHCGRQHAHDGVGRSDESSYLYSTSILSTPSERHTRHPKADRHMRAILVRAVGLACLGLESRLWSSQSW